MNTIFKYVDKNLNFLIAVIAILIYISRNHYSSLEYIAHGSAGLLILVFILKTIVTRIEWLKIIKLNNELSEEGFNSEYIEKEIEKVKSNNTISEHTKNKIIDKMNDAKEQLTK